MTRARSLSSPSSHLVEIMVAGALRVAAGFVVADRMVLAMGLDRREDVRVPARRVEANIGKSEGRHGGERVERTENGISRPRLWLKPSTVSGVPQSARIGYLTERELTRTAPRHRLGRTSLVR